MGIMSVAQARRARPETALVPLENGERLDQPTFHARYEAMPAGTRAELIQGIVYVMPSPVSSSHGSGHFEVIAWLAEYAAAHPEVRGLDNPTIILGPESEPQPDACLCVLPAHGGQTKTVGNYVHGAPELIVEIALSTTSYDLHQKLRDYERAGVEEYVVVLLKRAEVRWFRLENGRYVRLLPGEDGIFRSVRFPGLWLNADALLTGDLAALKRTVLEGLGGTASSG